MTTPYQQQFDAILNGLDIDPDHHQITLLRDGSVLDYQPATLRPTLTQLLYQHFYTTANEPLTSIPLTSDISFEDTLNRANHSKEYFDSPWTVEAVDQAGVAYAAKGNYKRMLFAGEYVYDLPRRGATQEGDVLRLLVRAEQRDAQSGFYYIFGQTPGDDHSTALQTRLYFHLTAEGAAPLVAWLTRMLNTYHVPFQFKCLNQPDLYGRSDSAVLYLQKPFVNLVMQQLADHLPLINPFLHPSIPLFTRLLAPGIAFAESPPNPNESFGMSRCGLLAQGIVNAIEAQAPTDQYFKAVKSVFEQIGLSLDQPYLNPRSQYPYQFPAAFA